jgi:homoserine O-acetyltransferase
MVTRAGAGYNGNDRYIDLRVEDHAEPIPELARILGVHKEFFRGAHRRRPQRSAPDTKAPQSALEAKSPAQVSATQTPAAAAAVAQVTEQPAQGRRGRGRGRGQTPRNYPDPVAGDHILRDFKFNSGETLPELKMHYQTIGSPVRDGQGIVRNAVLILHGTTGSSNQFLGRSWADELYGPGQILDATKYYIVIVDNVGHGQSSKPSDGLRAKFPKYGYRDMIEAQYRLLNEGLGVNHLRLVIGTSMGGMHAWFWGSLHPDYMDALMPLASLPTQISGRNRMWRRILIDAIKNSHDYNDGNYTEQPAGLRTAAAMMSFMADNTVRRQRSAPTLAEADELFERGIRGYLGNRSYDANDVLYAFEASHDYDPGPGLDEIKAPLFAINFADDLINPPELGILEEAIKRVPKGKAITYPLSEQTSGHGTHTNARVWKEHLEALMKQTEAKNTN